jgi:glycosyltransferase involved in cell wall biosynthesis
LTFNSETELNKKSYLQPLMLLIKFFIGLFPLKVKVLMRKNLWAHNLYSKSLRRSGLFYGFPNPEKLQNLYVKNMLKQSKIISLMCSETAGTFKLNVGFVLSGDIKADLIGVRQIQAIHAVKKIFIGGTVKHVQVFFAAINDDKSTPIINEFTSENFDDSSPLLLLRAGDQLHTKGVEVFLKTLKNNDSKSIILYCDCDTLDSNIGHHNGEFKPDWNPDLQLASSYIRTGVLISQGPILLELWQFVQQHSSQQLISLWLAHIYLKECAVDVVHIPLTLVHQSIKYDKGWPNALSKLSDGSFELLKSDSSKLASLQWHKQKQPMVSLIIPTKNEKELLQTCIESILNHTDYRNFEIILVDNNSDESDALTYLDLLRKNDKISVLLYPYKFNYSAINNFAIQHAKGEIVGLINNDIEVISSNWLTMMVGHAVRDDIGCVGAKLLYPDGTVQHAGVVMGYGGGAGHAHKYFPGNNRGYLNRLAVSHNFSAVTGACLLVKKLDYLAVDGLNETDLPVAFNDVDFCLKVLALGRRNLYCAEAVLYHHESISRGLDDTQEKRARFEVELAYLQHKWKGYIDHDPAYNPNLTLRRENFSIKENTEY